MLNSEFSEKLGSPSGAVGVPVGNSISEPAGDPDLDRSDAKNGDSIFDQIEPPWGAIGVSKWRVHF